MSATAAEGISHMQRVNEVVNAAIAVVRTSSQTLNDWASEADIKLVDAVDAFLSPASVKLGKKCDSDAAEEHPSQEVPTGRYLCRRPPSHIGGHHYRDTRR